MLKYFVDFFDDLHGQKLGSQIIVSLNDDLPNPVGGEFAVDRFVSDLLLLQLPGNSPRPVGHGFHAIFFLQGFFKGLFAR